MRRTLVPILGLALYALAVAAGTPCPDPQRQLRIQDGKCIPATAANGDPFFYSQMPSFTRGGCIDPGNSAQECEVHHYPLPYKIPVTGGRCYDDENDGWEECSEMSATKNALYGVSTTDCDYCK